MYSTDGLLTAADMMTSDVVTVGPDQPTRQAVELLLENRISGAPVVDSSQNLVGIFSERDSIRAMMGAIHQDRPSSVVSDYMVTENLITVYPETSLFTIGHLFATNSVRRLPVIRADGRLVGLISRRDLLRAALKVMETAPSREAALEYLGSGS
ncbi:MAG: CBS domain-containing protein [Myxococcota bacterium]|nr:CBS domain-containing protein [Myxococcota bacterium]MEE2780478.1 CBS domain-containing protein [Myxococcota bacterium]